MRTRPILCLTDFSKTASHALSYAIELAQLYGVSLRIIHIASKPYGPHNYGIPVHSDTEIEDRILAYAHTQLDEWVKTAKTQLSGLNVSSQIRIGDVVEQILMDAETCDIGMIVIASHGHQGVAHLLNANIAEAVANQAKCPVLVVK